MSKWFEEENDDSNFGPYAIIVKGVYDTYILKNHYNMYNISNRRNYEELATLRFNESLVTETYCKDKSIALFNKMESDSMICFLYKNIDSTFNIYKLKIDIKEYE